MSKYKNLKCDESTYYSLINEIKGRQCIWNSEFEKYNERSYTASAWFEIASKLKLPVAFLRMKWKYLRDTHRRELKKLKPEGYLGRWRYFAAMSFLNQSVEQENNSENLETFFVHYDDQDRYSISQEQHDTDPLPPKKKKRNQEDDYDVLFLTSLMPYFRELEPMRKLVFRSKIQELLIHELVRNTSGNVVQTKLYSNEL